MNTAKLRSKRVILPTLAAVVALGVGGTVWASAASADVSGGERDRVAEAAVRAAGGGTASDVEAGDDQGVAYEVDVRKQDGSEVEVTLDKDLKVLGQEADTPDADDTPDAANSAEAGDTPDAGDRVLSATERTSAEQAAKGAVAGGTVLDVSASDDPGVAYEVDIRDAANAEWDVELDAAFKVLRKTAD